ncbi:MAG: DNA repair protein RecN [Bacillota bacterium]
MLLQFRVENFALVQKALLTFEEGLNVLTGETGAGKSIIVDAMAVLLGGRAFQDYIRSGEDRAYVEGLFWCGKTPEVALLLDSIGITSESDGNVILSREITRGGKSTCRINGRAVALSTYQELGHLLVDLHGQHDHQSLLSPAKQLYLLDSYGGKEVMDLREAVRSTYNQIKILTSQINELKINQRERLKQQEMYRFQVAEIDQACLCPGEELELLNRKRLMANGEKLIAGTDQVYSCLVGDNELGNAYDLISTAISTLKELSKLDPSFLKYLNELENINYVLEEMGRYLRKYRDAIDFNHEDMIQVEQRLALIKQLMKKYGDSVEDVLKYRNEAAIALEDLSTSEDKLNFLEEELVKIIDHYNAQCLKLGEARRFVGNRFSSEVATNLQELEMPYANFILDITQRLDYHPVGKEEIEFLFSPNRGEPPKALTKIASGGELSRVMLAIKTVFADLDDVPTLIFDEIDTGIGGRTAQAVANKLKSLAKQRQVICVTHLPQIASLADVHFLLAKVESGERTITMVTKLNEAGCIEELVRMMGGSTNCPITVSHAKEMRKHKI